MVEEKIGIVEHFFTNASVAAVRITNGVLHQGEIIHIVGAHTDFSQTVESMQINKDSVKTVQAGDEVGIKVIERVRENDIVYKPNL